MLARRSIVDIYVDRTIPRVEDPQFIAEQLPTPPTGAQQKPEALQMDQVQRPDFGFRQTLCHQRELATMRWGLVPRWWSKS
jgi:putative SOS response-associated peptidase YedK